jgi:hypothetical protein
MVDLCGGPAGPVALLDDLRRTGSSRFRELLLLTVEGLRRESATRPKLFERAVGFDFGFGFKFVGGRALGLGLGLGFGFGFDFGFGFGFGFGLGLGLDLVLDRGLFAVSAPVDVVDVVGVVDAAADAADAADATDAASVGFSNNSSAKENSSRVNGVQVRRGVLRLRTTCSTENISLGNTMMRAASSLQIDPDEGVETAAAAEVELWRLRLLPLRLGRRFATTGGSHGVRKNEYGLELTAQGWRRLIRARTLFETDEYRSDSGRRLNMN